MIYDVKKFLFVGVEKERDLFFRRAQELGIIHFITPKGFAPAVLSENMAVIAQAIKVLRGLPVMEQEETEEYEIASGLAHKIVTLKKELESLQEEQRITHLDMRRVEIFGDFSLGEIAQLEKEAHRKIQYYCSKRGLAETLALPDEVLFVGSDHDLDYFIGINKAPQQYPKLLEMIIEKPFGALKKRYQEIEREIAATDVRLKGYAKYSRLLHHAYLHQWNSHELEKAKECVAFPITEETLFVIQGWVPLNKIDQLNSLVKDMKVYYEEVEIEPTDAVPTSLQNSGFAKIGEDLVHIYDTPSTTDKDPSLWVLFFFSLFFSMVIGDGGYGLVLLLIAVYVRHKYAKALRGGWRRALDLMTILAFSCIAWGVLTTSFFGVTIAPDSVLRKVSMMSWLVEKKAAYHMQRKDDVYKEWVKKYPDLSGVTDPTDFLMKASSKNEQGKVSYDAYSKFSDNIMLEMALFIGVLHIIISMLRYVKRNWSHVGWVIFLIGAYLYTPVFLHATSLVNFAFGIDRERAAHNGLYLVYGGVILAVVIALFRHKLFGLLEASHVIQIFGDVLSYLRLYALGLAGSLLTATMIDLSAGVPFVFGLLILLFGHVVNIALSIMGGVIHGLRLNFLEWYHYCFEGGGKIFNPLRKQDID